MNTESLSNLWFFLLALVWSIYLIQELNVSGVGILSILTLNDEKKYMLVNRLVGTHWDGIQVWLILAVGGTFAAFPSAYATILTELYIPIFLLLYTIIFRGIAIELSDKTTSHKLSNILRKIWIVSSFCLLIILALYTSNLFIGLPIGKNGLNASFFSFTFIFNMISFFMAIGFILLGISLGSIYICLNSLIPKNDRIIMITKLAPLIATICMLFVFIGLNSKADIFTRGFYQDYPILWLLPSLSAFLLIYGSICAYVGRIYQSFIALLLGVLLFVLSGYMSLAPYFVYSTVDPKYSLTILDASSNESTLSIMLIATVIFLPIVITYQAFKYIKFWNK